MDTNTKLLARLKSGFLIKNIYERFTMKKDSTLSPDRVLFLYSAHDETIINVLNALNLFEVLKPIIYIKMAGLIVFIICFGCSHTCQPMHHAYFLSFIN